jgi:hypothetical protein
VAASVRRGATDRGTACDDSGVRIGPVDPSGVVRNDRGVRIGAVTSEGVVDFAGVRIGQVVEYYSRRS